MQGMTAVDLPHAHDARWLSLHSLVVGVGWFVVAFAGLVGLQVADAPRQWAETWPTAAQGIGWTVVLVAAVPLAWPFYIAIGWCESGLASRLRAGDDSVRPRAVRLLRAQALAFAVPTVVAGFFAWRYRHGETAYLSLTWLPLAVITGLHAVTARTLDRAPTRSAGGRSGS